MKISSRVAAAALVLAAAGVAPTAAAGERPLTLSLNASRTDVPDDTVGKHRSRHSRPEFLGKGYPSERHKGFLLIATPTPEPSAPPAARFFVKVKETIDVVERESPFFFRLLRAMNVEGERVIYYRGRPGPASFNAWEDLYVVRLASNHIDDDPVFDNNPYQLGATLVHELIGHGKQHADGRLWPMYDWCGRDGWQVPGVAWKENRFGASSGYVEYEPYLYAKWFLETVQRPYPNYDERIVRRYVQAIRFLDARFPGWHDDRRKPWELLQSFKEHFARICPGVAYTGHSLPPG